MIKLILPLLIVTLTSISFSNEQDSIFNFLNVSNIRKIIYNEQNHTFLGATTGGYVEFDLEGKVTRTLNSFNGLRSSHIMDIVKDKNNNIWFTSDKSLYLLQNNELKEFNLENCDSVFFADRINSLIIGNDSLLYVASTNNIKVFNINNLSHFPAYKHESGKLIKDHGNNIWSTSQYYNDTTQKTSVTLLNSENIGNKSFLIDGYMFSNTHLLFDKNGNLWKCELQNALVYDSSNGELIVTHSNIPGEYSISTIAEDHNGNIWLGWGNGSLSKYNGAAWETYSIPSLLNQIMQLYFSEDNTCYILTPSGEISIFTESNFEKFKIKSLYDDRIQQIDVDNNGTCYFNTYNKYGKYENNQFIIINNSKANDLAVDKNDGLWVLSSNYIYYYKNDKAITASWDNSKAYKLSVKSDGKIFLGTYELTIDSSDISSWDIIINKPYIYFYDDTITAIYQDTLNKMWIGTNEDLWYGDSSQMQRYSSYLTNSSIIDIIEAPDKRLLITTQNGINYYNGNFFVKQTYPTIPFNKIIDLDFDTQNKLWACTDNGLFILEDNSWTNYETDKPIDACNLTSIAIDNNNNKWIGTANNGIILIKSNNSSPIADEKKKLSYDHGLKLKMNSRYIIITFNSASSLKVLRLYDLMGKVVKVLNLENYRDNKIQIDLNNLSSGCYILNIKDLNGQTFSRRVVKR